MRRIEKSPRQRAADEGVGTPHQQREADPPAKLPRQFAHHREQVTRALPVTAAVRAVLANERAFRKLSADVQKAVLDAAQAAEARGWKMSEEQNVEAPKTLAKNGLKVEPMTPQFRGELKRIGLTMLADWLAKAKEDGRKVIDAYRKLVPQPASL